MAFRSIEIYQRQFSRSGCAFTPAFGRVEAYFACDFYGTAEAVPLRFVLSREWWDAASEKQIPFGNDNQKSEARQTTLSQRVIELK